MDDRGLMRRAHVLVALARSDLRIRYGRGPWQLVNWLVQPFAMVGIYLLLRIMLSRGGGAAALSISCAVVPFQMIMLTIESSMSAVSLREPVLLNRSFDRLLLPAATVLTETVAFGASFLLFPLTMLFGGVAPTVALVWLPLVMAVTLLLALGIAWPMTLLGMWFPQLKVLVAQAARVLFFAAPGVLALDELSETVQRWVVINPLTGVFEGFRSVFVEGERPDFGLLAVPAATGFVLTAVSLPVYRREQRHFAKLVRS